MFTFIIVDDCISDIEGISSIIGWNSIGFELIGTAENGLLGLELALEKKPDLVITDVSMPKMDGIEMVAKIKQHLPQTKFIVMSCYEEFEYVHRSIIEGVYSYILKPINVDELVETALQLKDMKEETIKKQLREYKIHQQIQKSNSILKEYFLLNLTYKRFDDNKNIYAQAKQLNIKTDSPFRIILLSLNDVDKKDIYVNEFVAKKILENALLSEFEGIIFLREYSLLITIVWSDDINLLKEKIIQCMSALQDEDISSTVVISNTVNSIFDLYENFEAVYQTAICSDGKYGLLLFQNDIRKKNISEYNITTIIDEIEHLFKDCDEGKIKEFVDKYMEIDNSGLKETKKSFVYSVLSITCVILAERGEDIDDIFGSNTDLWTKVSNFNYDYDLKTWLYNILVHINQYIFTRQNDKHAKIISEAKQYMDENYNKNIIVQDVADHIGMSAGYINRLFKKYTRETINDYLTKKKMIEAARLLRETNLKILEVANIMGYDSNSYFSSVFKSFYNISPTEYKTSRNGRK